MLLSELAIHLAEDLEIRLALNEGGPVNGVVDLIVGNSVKNDGVVVIGKLLDESSGRRDYDLILALGVDDVENTVLIVVRLIRISVALHQSKSVSERVSVVRSGRVQGEGAVLRRYGSVVLGDDPVLLVDDPVVGINGVEQPVGVAVVREAYSGEQQVRDRQVDANSERRSADYPVPSIGPVVNPVIQAVLDSPVGQSPVARRQVANPVAIVVRSMTPEVSRMVIREEVTIPRRDSVDVPVLSNPHEVVAGLTHHVVAGARHILVVSGETTTGGVANALASLPGTVCGSAAGDIAP